MNRFVRLLTALALSCVLCACLAIPCSAARGSTPECSWRHILLVGVDRRPGEKNARSDSMILCSFCPDKKEMVMTSNTFCLQKRLSFQSTIQKVCSIISMLRSNFNYLPIVLKTRAISKQSKLR